MIMALADQVRIYPHTASHYIVIVKGWVRSGEGVGEEESERGREGGEEK